MESITGAGVQPSISAEVAAGVIKDTTGAQLITMTLDKLNTGMALSGPVVNPDHQFQKDMLNAAGIGTKLDTIA